MARLPFQQAQVLPGTQVSSPGGGGISPPPSPAGLMQAGSDFYKAQGQLGADMMDLGTSIAQAIMVDKREGEREQEMNDIEVENDLVTLLKREYLARERLYKGQNLGATDIETQLKQDFFHPVKLKRTISYVTPELGKGKESFLLRAQKIAKERGASDRLIKSLDTKFRNATMSIERSILLDQMSEAEKDKEGRKQLAFSEASNDLRDLLQKTRLNNLMNKSTYEVTKSYLKFVEGEVDRLVEKNFTKENGYEPDDEVAKGRFKVKLRSQYLTESDRIKTAAVEASLTKEGKKKSRVFSKILEEFELTVTSLSQSVQINEDAVIDNSTSTMLSESLEEIKLDQIKKAYGDDIPDDVLEFINDGLIGVVVGPNNEITGRQLAEFLKVRQKDRAEKEVRDNQEEALAIQNALNDFGEHISIEREDWNKRKLEDQDDKGTIANLESALNLVLGKWSREGKELFNQKLKTSLENRLGPEKSSYRETLAAQRREFLDAQEKSVLAELERKKEIRITTAVNEAVVDFMRGASEYSLDYIKNPDAVGSPQQFEATLNELKEKSILGKVGIQEGANITEDDLDEEKKEIVKRARAEFSTGNILHSTWFTLSRRMLEEDIADNVRDQEKIWMKIVDKTIEDEMAKPGSPLEIMGRINTTLDLERPKIEANLKNPRAKVNFFRGTTHEDWTRGRLAKTKSDLLTAQGAKITQDIETFADEVSSRVGFISGFNPGSASRKERKGLDQWLISIDDLDDKAFDYRMRIIAEKIMPHVCENGCLYNRVQAKDLLVHYAGEIDKNDAREMIESNPATAAALLRPLSDQLKGLEGKKREEAFDEILFPNLEKNERAILHNQAKNNVTRNNNISTARLRLGMANNRIAIIKPGDSGDITDGMSYLEKQVKPYVGVEGGIEQWEYDTEVSRVKYAMDIAQAKFGVKPGANKKYGERPLEEKTREQILNILKDFDPKTYPKLDDHDRRNMETVYGMVNDELRTVLQKRDSDGAFFPAMEFARDNQGRKFSLFDEDRIEYIHRRQREYGVTENEIVSFTKDELEKLDQGWKDGNGLDRAGMLKQMESASADNSTVKKDPKVFHKMLEDMVKFTSMDYPDLLYLEHFGNAVVLKRIHGAKTLKEAAINITLKEAGVESTEIYSSLFGYELLDDYMAAFPVNERAAWYQFLRAYSVNVMQGNDHINAVKDSVDDLLVSLYDVHSGNVFQGPGIEENSVWIPKEFFGDIDKQQPFLVDQDLYGLALKRFITKDAPGLVGEDHNVFFAEKNYHFRNSDDNQGLVLHYLDTRNDPPDSYPVAHVDKKRKDRRIVLEWNRLSGIVKEVVESMRPPEIKAAGVLEGVFKGLFLKPSELEVKKRKDLWKSRMEGTIVDLPALRAE